MHDNPPPVLMEPRVLAPVFVLGGNLFVPHYTQRDIWVTYTGKVMSTSELRQLGAMCVPEWLWSRPWLLVKENVCEPE